MDNYNLEETKKTPKIEYDYNTNIFIMQGRCIPSDAQDFFEPIIGIFKSLKLDRKLVCNLTLDYINSTSSKWLIVAIKDLNEKYSQGLDIEINWFYEDDDTFDFGELIEEVASFKVNRIKLEEDDDNSLT